jgi:hypothetical protein
MKHDRLVAGGVLGGVATWLLECAGPTAAAGPGMRNQ